MSERFRMSRANGGPGAPKRLHTNNFRSQKAGVGSQNGGLKNFNSCLLTPVF